MRNKNFTGREDLLNRLRTGIGDNVTAVVPHTLHGLGGSGKTQLAIEYAYRFRDSYDVVWWVPADQPGLVRATLAQLAPQLGVPDAITAGIEDAANAVLEALRRGDPYARWLLIFDNADQPEDFAELIPPGPGDVLVTSRNPRWAGVYETIAVDVFPRKESMEFLAKRMSSVTIEESDKLAEALGDLPLALEQAAALQVETGMPAQEYLRLFEQQASSLLKEGKPPEYPWSMTTAWRLSVTKLREHLPQAMELLRTCAFFGPEPIPRDAFRPVKGPVRREVADLLANPIQLSKAIATLARYALVRIDPDERTLQVHRLIQALLREELPAPLRDEIRSEVHSLIVEAAPVDFDHPVNWPRYQALLAHVDPAEVAKSTRPDVRSFAHDMLGALVSWGDYRTAGRYADTFVHQWSRDSGADDPDVLRAQRVKGDMLREFGRYTDAYELNTATLATMREVMGADHREVLILLNGIGADLRGRGRFIEAREHDKASVERHRAVLGSDDVQTLRAIANLAIDYGLTSDYRASQRLLEEAYRTALANRGQVSRGAFLNLWAGLARSVRQCGDYHEACDVGSDALGYGRQHLGADHPRVLLVQRDLAIAQLRAGEREEGLELARDVHARYMRIYGLNHPGTLAAAVCLANSLRANGLVEDAYLLAKDTMERCVSVYGSEHPYHFGCIGNVALLERVRGEPARAYELNERALAGLEERLGRGHHYALTVAVNLAGDLAALGEHEQACRLGEESLQRLRRLLGEQHPASLAAAANLAADLSAAGRGDEAKRLFEETMRRYGETLGHEHPDALVAAEGRHLDLDFDPPPI
ncbi:FxSxx-COOH system tetratricopeptide repeat protein [Nonomuraea rubra]|uniref:Tetratricopeptide (TPR) repeat protein n=1 Tax=Nonomuraea rubra TaxID=46180 RepID=A0A7X0NL06_9ACTN|nr:FxSxx-COOH system tetratricopeptide repeat protein [Nonomuraea rubra]MBB6545407.1 tetratricopeptide (TPR) repeat protein [Nonomuraea rubra]